MNKHKSITKERSGEGRRLGWAAKHEKICCQAVEEPNHPNHTIARSIIHVSPSGLNDLFHVIDYFDNCPIIGQDKDNYSATCADQLTSIMVAAHAHSTQPTCFKCVHNEARSQIFAAIQKRWDKRRKKTQWDIRRHHPLYPYHMSRPRNSVMAASIDSCVRHSYSPNFDKQPMMVSNNSINNTF